MKKRTISAFFKEMMLRGLRLLMWLWLCLLWRVQLGRKGMGTSATFPEGCAKKRTDCELRTKRVHLSLAPMRGARFGAGSPGDHAYPAFASIAGPVK
jgi:hypothetical protein